MSETENLGSDSVIAKTSVPLSEQYYCSEDDWRNFTMLTNQYDFPSATVVQTLKDATEQVKKDGFYMVRSELVTKDSNDRYWTARKYWADRYNRNDTAIPISNGIIDKYDLIVMEAETVSSTAGSLLGYGQANVIFYQIPYDAIIQVDGFNCFFKLSSEYPTQNRQIYVTYWVANKPIEELHYALQRACIEMTTILMFKKLKTKRMKKGTIQFTLGKQTIIRDEESFDKMVQDHYQEYHKWINWFKPFVGKRAKIGRMETGNDRRFVYN